MLAGRRIVLGVSGGIAAYKAAYLARRLVEDGAQVRCVMSEASTRFLGAPTLAAITGEHPIVGLFDGPGVSPHTELGSWAEAMVIAPATAATLSKLAGGLSDNALVATALATAAPLLVAPAMHTAMWENAATRRNIEFLASSGVIVVGPESGALAGGDVGTGRMADPDAIIRALKDRIAGELSGWKVLVTSGGTREPIDPVRYIGNRSSGRMGNAIAREAADRGAAVTLVTTVDAPVAAGIEVVPVETAAEMADAVTRRVGEMDVAVMAAAVADFRPVNAAADKLRRIDGVPEIILEPTPDVLGAVAVMPDRPFLVGFAAEAGSLDGAVRKATTKGVDLLVGNDVEKPGSGFGTLTNEVTVYTPDGRSEAWPLMSKREVAQRLWDRITRMHRPG